MREGEGTVVPAVKPIDTRGGVTVSECRVPPRYDFPAERVTLIRETKSTQARFEIRTLEGKGTTVIEHVYDALLRSFTGKLGDWQHNHRRDHTLEGGHDGAVAFYAAELRAELAARSTAKDDAA